MSLELEQITINEFPRRDNPFPINRGKKKEEKKKKEKGLFNKLFNKRKLNKPNKTAVIYLRNNGKAEMIEAESKRGFFEINGKTYHEDKDCIYRVGKEGIPLAVIEENSMVPIGTRAWYEKRPTESTIDLMQRKFSELQDHLLRGIRHIELVRQGERERMKISGKAIVGLIILGIVVLVVATNYI